MEYLRMMLGRLKEPSTYAGLSAASVLFAVSADAMNEWTIGVAGIFAFLSVILGEAK